MVISKLDIHDEEIKKLIKQIAVICLSEEFISLRKELEKIYTRCGYDNPTLYAFQDALFTILSEERDVSIKTHSY